MGETQYGLYFVNTKTGERHHMRKGTHPADIEALVRKALWIADDFEKKEGGHYQRHSYWATGMEIWEFPYGDHDEFEKPDRRLAHIAWGDDEFTIESGVDRAPFHATEAGDE